MLQHFKGHSITHIGNMQITVQIPNGDKVSLDVGQDEKISKVKELIHEKDKSLSLKEMRLFSSNVELVGDERPLYPVTALSDDTQSVLGLFTSKQHLVFAKPEDDTFVLTLVVLRGDDNASHITLEQIQERNEQHKKSGGMTLSDLKLQSESCIEVRMGEEEGDTENDNVIRVKVEGKDGLLQLSDDINTVGDLKKAIEKQIDAEESKDLSKLNKKELVEQVITLRKQLKRSRDSISNGATPAKRARKSSGFFSNLFEKIRSPFH